MPSEITITKRLDDEQTDAMAYAVKNDVLQSRESGDPATIFHALCDAQIEEAVKVYHQSIPKARKTAFDTMDKSHEELATRLTLALAKAKDADIQVKADVLVKLTEAVDVAEAAAASVLGEG